MAYMLRLIILFALADFAIPAIFNGTFDPLTQVNATGDENAIITRRKAKGKIDRSTSSSSNEKKGGDSSDSGHSLDLSLSESTASDKKNKKAPKKDYKPKSSRERTGWRKWHRKCQQCPEDMRMKWRDPGIKWICGAYQRARRSFKSLCMMHYRNCQDGTMFTKVADHRCQNASDILNHGDHFFYDYKVDLSIDSSNSEDSSSSKSSSKSSEKSSESLNSERVASLENLVINDLAIRKKKF